jgi:3-hydroxybutyryl-CoA dehydratase
VPEAIEVGNVFSFRRTLTAGDIALFIGVTWDVDPLHTDAIYAESTDFGRPIVPGLLTASLLTHLGGLWAFMATHMDLTFVSPVYVGDTIKAQAEIIALEAERGRARLRCHCSNQHGEEVLWGRLKDSLVISPRMKDKLKYQWSPGSRPALR